MHRPEQRSKVSDFRRRNMEKRNQQTALRNDAQLDSRLSDYSAATRVSAMAGRLHGRIGSWPIYAAAAGSALAMATSASASIITGTYSPGSNSVQPLSLGVSSEKSGALDFGTDHILIKAISRSIGFGPTVVLSVFGVSPVGILESSGAYSQRARKFVSGSPISGGHYADSGRIVQSNFSGHNYGQFIAGSTAFVGLAIKAGNQIDYGWLKLVFTDNSFGVAETLTAIAYGIETDGGVPIDAGQTVEVTPEPGTMALAILAAGAAGVAALRRRRTLTPIQR